MGTTTAERPSGFDAFSALCPSRRLLDTIGDKWVSLAIVALGLRGPLRYSELASQIEGVSQKMLTQSLRKMERDGLLIRTVTPSVPVRTDYELTPLGQTLCRSSVTSRPGPRSTCRRSTRLGRCTTAGAAISRSDATKRAVRASQGWDDESTGWIYLAGICYSRSEDAAPTTDGGRNRGPRRARGGRLWVDEGRGGRLVTICLRDRGSRPSEQHTIVPDSVLTGGHGGFAGED